MIQIILVTILCAVIVIYLKSINSELALLATIGSGIIIIGVALNYLSGIIDVINKIASYTGISSELYSIIFKITGIAYLIEFGAGTLEDFGLNNFANKLVFVGKLVILSTSLPIIYSVFNILVEILQ